VIARLREQRGATLVEFALVFPVFFLVITGSVAMVWLVGVRSTITGAARDGARYASIQTDPLAGYPTQPQVAAFVTNRANNVGVDSVTVTPSNPTRNQIIKVTVTRHLPSLFGIFNVTYSSTAEARAE